jgi:hypothetical protein
MDNADSEIESILTKKKGQESSMQLSGLRMLSVALDDQILQDLCEMNSIDDLFCKVLEHNNQVDSLQLLESHKSVMQSRAEYTYHLVRREDDEAKIDLLVNQF